jgi:hypothetical protein
MEEKKKKKILNAKEEKQKNRLKRSRRDRRVSMVDSRRRKSVSHSPRDEHFDSILDEAGLYFYLFSCDSH